MSKVLFSTRKGLVEMAVRDGNLHYQKAHFLGDPISITATDDAGHWWAAMAVGE